MRSVTYKDPDGRLFKVLLPNDVPDTQAQYGIVVGPAELMDLSLPPEVEVRLNNQLFYRNLFTLAEVRKRPQDVIAALQAALKVDYQKVVEAYIRGE